MRRISDAIAMMGEKEDGLRLWRRVYKLPLRLELRFIAHDILMGCSIPEAEEMGIAFVKGAEGQGATLKTKFPIKGGVTQNKKSAFPNDLLPQGKTEQFGADPLMLHLWFNGQRGQMQAADFCTVIRVGKSDVGGDGIAMQAYPFMQHPFFFMECIKQVDFIAAARKGLLQQRGNLGVLSQGEWTNLHLFNQFVVDFLRKPI